MTILRRMADLKQTPLPVYDAKYESTQSSMQYSFHLQCCMCLSICIIISLVKHHCNAFNNTTIFFLFYQYCLIEHCRQRPRSLSLQQLIKTSPSDSIMRENQQVLMKLSQKDRQCNAPKFPPLFFYHYFLSQQDHHRHFLSS